MILTLIDIIVCIIKCPHCGTRYYVTDYDPDQECLCIQCDWTFIAEEAEEF